MKFSVSQTLSNMVLDGRAIATGAATVTMAVLAPSSVVSTVLLIANVVNSISSVLSIFGL